MVAAGRGAGGKIGQTSRCSERTSGGLSQSPEPHNGRYRQASRQKSRSPERHIILPLPCGRGTSMDPKRQTVLNALLRLTGEP